MKTFTSAVRTRDFVVAAECFLRPESGAESIRIQAEMLRDNVDAVMLTDNQYGSLHMSTVSAARLFLDNEVDPIVQLSCRNRNRISLIADILGGAALGVTSFHLVRGNRVPMNIEPRPKAVLDITASQLVAVAANLQADDALRNVPELFIGTRITPHEPKAGWHPVKLAEKADAGAKFSVTHICMDLELLRRYMKQLVAAKITHRISVIVSTAILTSAEDARFLRDNRPNMIIPDSLIERLEKSTDPRSEGLTICIEQLRELAAIPGVSGANIIASTDLSMVPEAVAAAGLSGS